MSAPRIEVLDGDLPVDGWATGKLAVKVRSEVRARVIRISVRNPHVAAMHQRNEVRVDIDGERVFHDVMFTGVSMSVDHALPAREGMLVEITSEAVMAPDALDPRERGVYVKFSEVDPAKARSSKSSTLPLWASAFTHLRGKERR